MNFQLPDAQFITLSIVVGIAFFAIQSVYRVSSLSRRRRNLQPIYAPPDFETSQNGVSRDADVRARQLLLEYLSPEQRAQWRSQNMFVAIGNRSKRGYVITMNTVYSEDKRFCLVTDHDHVPADDLVLMRKLLIETDEKLFLSTARATARR